VNICCHSAHTWEHSANTRLYRQLASLTVPLHRARAKVHSRYTLGTLKVHSRDTRGTLEAHSGYTQGTLKLLSRYTPGTLKVHSRYIQGTVKGHSGYTRRIPGNTRPTRGCTDSSPASPYLYTGHEQRYTLGTIKVHSRYTQGTLSEADHTLISIILSNNNRFTNSFHRKIPR